MEVAVLVNPVSGGGRALKSIPAIEKAFRGLAVPHIFTTRYQGHASELALSLSGQAGLRAIVAAGGDGTVNEVASGLFGSAMPLGIIPLGSGNGLGRQLGITKGIAQACAVIAEGYSMLMDSGTVNGRPFFVTTGIGFDGRVASHFAGSKKRGLSAYVTSVLALLKDLAPFMAEVRMEGPEGSIKRSGLYSLLVTANAEQYGNNAYIAPGALLNDGLLNLTAIGPVNLLQAGQLGRSLFSKTLASHSLVECLPATNVQIITHKPQFFHLDGEPCGKETTFNIEVRKHSLRVLASLKRYH